MRRSARCSIWAARRWRTTSLSCARGEAASSMNAALLFHRTALASPASPALLLGSRLVADHAGLHQRVVQTACWLQHQGIGKGDRVALFMRNHIEYLEWLLATLWIGAIVVPVNFKLHPRELDYILSHSGAALLVVCSEGAAALQDGGLTWRGRHVNTDSEPHYLDGDGDRTLEAPRVMPADACAWLFYTSGTTGRPKGVEIVHRNILAMTLAYFASVDAITSSDAMLYAAPMSHGAGLYAFPALMAGARHVIPESAGFHAPEILALAQSVGGICMFAAPTMVRRLVDAAQKDPTGIDGIKTIAYGGGPMYVADIRRALDVMGGRFVQIYGQGESPMTISALSRAE
ncbi:MAG: long-chain fatty acid--CoA ligase, partial [Haliea sp.]